MDKVKYFRELWTSGIHIYHMNMKYEAWATQYNPEEVLISLMIKWNSKQTNAFSLFNNYINIIFSCCIFLYMCVFFLVRIYPSVLHSECAFFSCAYIHMRFFLCAFFQCAFFRPSFIRCIASHWFDVTSWVCSQIKRTLTFNTIELIVIRYRLYTDNSRLNLYLSI